MAYTTIDDPAQHFNTVLFTGDIEDSDGTSHDQAVTGVGFTPDWVWHKCRSHANQHLIVDSVRGSGGSPTQMLFLSSGDSENEKNTNTNGAIKSIDSDGFTVTSGNDSSSKSNNAGANGRTYVDWCWKAGGSASSNSDGTITTSVSANTTAGFSIVSYTSNGTASQTVGHGLGAVPHAIISKNRDSTSSSYNYWTIYHHKNATANDKKLKLNEQDQVSTTNEWGDTDPTSTKYYVHTGGDGTTNVSTDKIISYCFTGIKGYSKFGTYTGNGHADGKFVYTGFRPAWLMIKRTVGNTGSWVIHDNKRDPINIAKNNVDADNGSAEAALDRLDILSNGFKSRSTLGFNNESGHTYIYFAFAESPFVNSNGIPTNAR